MVLDNDTRGWVLACISGIACVVGSSIIFADLVIQRLPGYHGFRIQDSNAFLSSSLSLSFGVMLFSSLYSILPSSKNYLIDGGFAPGAAVYILIGCFLGGALGIQILSKFLHRYIPSEVVDCGDVNDQRDHDRHGSSAEYPPSIDSCNDQSEETPLLSRNNHPHKPSVGYRSRSVGEENGGRRPAPPFTARIWRLLTRSKASCMTDGRCYGFGDPCFPERSRRVSRDRGEGRNSRLVRTSAHPSPPGRHSSTPARDEESGGSDDNKPSKQSRLEIAVRSQLNGRSNGLPPMRNETPSKADDNGKSCCRGSSPQATSNASIHSDSAHHHHVFSNAFLSIGLQTSIAIALHKLPEGFITFATNHANRKLGFAVFMALFIHNITEGFAMALPLYLALRSRWKAMIWSSLLGGASQPLGAGLAAIWLKAAGRGEMAPGERVYGCMFAVTAGVMTSVALTLFSQSLGLAHNRDLCMIFAFVGMGILGISFALTAG